MRRTRDLTGDSAAMLALAHPTRLSLLELLGRDGPLTATEAGQRLGESAGTMSWHMRLLARHGFIAEAEGARGRRRPWTLTAMGTHWDADPQSPEELEAGLALSLTLAERAFGLLRTWLTNQHTARPEWRRAAMLDDWVLYLSADEAERLGEQIRELLEQFADRLPHPERRPADAVAVRALVAIHPQAPPDAGEHP